jgi:small GTP-binding protein
MYHPSLYKPTVGIDFLSRNLTVNNSTFRLQLWDTAGQEKYKSLVPAYLRDANAAIFVYDVSRKESLYNLKNWVQLYRDNQSV